MTNRRPILPLAVAFAIVAAAPASALEDGDCRAWLSAQPWGELQRDELTEVSGIAASHLDESILWLHNDSGGSANLYATGLMGEDRGD